MSPDASWVIGGGRVEHRRGTRGSEGRATYRITRLIQVRSLHRDEIAPASLYGPFRNTRGGAQLFADRGRVPPAKLSSKNFDERFHDRRDDRGPQTNGLAA